MFSGDYWVGADAMHMGMVDGMASFSSIVELKYDDLPLKDYTRSQSAWEKLNSMGAMFDAITNFLNKTSLN